MLPRLEESLPKADKEQKPLVLHACAGSVELVFQDFCFVKHCGVPRWKNSDERKKVLQNFSAGEISRRRY